MKPGHLIRGDLVTWYKAPEHGWRNLYVVLGVFNGGWAAKIAHLAHYHPEFGMRWRVTEPKMVDVTRLQKLRLTLEV